MKNPSIADIRRQLQLFHHPDEDSTLDAAQDWLERHAPEIARLLIALTDQQLTFSGPYPSGRTVLMLGQHKIGAVFPPFSASGRGSTWQFSLWLSSIGSGTREGMAESEQAAKNAILAEARHWLRKAGLQA